MAKSAAAKKSVTPKRKSVTKKVSKKAGVKRAVTKKSMTKRATTPRKPAVRTKRVSARPEGSPKRRTRRFADGEKLVKNKSGKVVSAAKSAQGKTSINGLHFALRRLAIDMLEDAGKLNPPMSSAVSLKDKMKLTSNSRPESRYNAGLIATVSDRLKQANAHVFAEAKANEKAKLAYLKKGTGAFTLVDISDL